VVSGVVDELLGSQGWMNLAALTRRLDDGGSLSGASLRVDPEARIGLYDTLRGMPRVAGVTVLGSLRKAFEDMMAKFMLGFAAILIGFAGLMAAGVVYNAARVSLAERERELASLRVLGFTRAEVSGILLGELAIQVALPSRSAACWAGSSHGCRPRERTTTCTGWPSSSCPGRMRWPVPWWCWSRWWFRWRCAAGWIAWTWCRC
jgi:hypothetical protein